MEYATNLIINKQYSIGRSAYQIVKFLAEMYDFRIHLIRSEEYGMLLPNTTRWNGLVGMVQRRFVDFGAQSFIYAKSRIPVMDSGFSIIKYRQSFVFCHPKITNQEKNVFLMPLDTKVWLCILGISFVTIVVLIVLHKTKGEDTLQENPTIISTINVIGLLAQQGLTSEHLNSVKSRMILLFFLLLSFTLFQFYSASIVGSLLAPVPRTITTHKRLLKTKLKIVMEEHPSSRIIFKIVTDTDLLNLYETKIKGHEVYVSINDGITKLRDENNVLLTYIDEVADQIKASLSHEQMEQLQVIPLFAQDHRALLYMPLVKEGAMNELVRVGNLKLTEVGLKKFVIDKYSVKLNEKAGKSFDPAVVDFARTASIFYALVIGIMISLIVFIVEFITVRWRKMKRNTLA